MKKGCSPRKKYGNGTSNAGIGPNNYIPNPAETLADYNIMLAKADQQALSNPWLPIVGTIGALGQSAVGLLGNKKPEVKAANGSPGLNSDVELEGGEMIETPAGQVQEIKGPTHENGGVPMQINQDIPEGTKVYSDRIKIEGKTMAERKATREKQIANIEKTVANGADLAIKNAAQRKMLAIQNQEQSDLEFQSFVDNAVHMTKSIMKAFGTGAEGIGATMRYDNGGVIPPITYSKGYDETMFKDFFTKYNEINPGAADMGAIQGDLGIPKTAEGFGQVFGPATYKAAQSWLTTNKDTKPANYKIGDGNGDGLTDSLATNPNINFEALKNFKIGEGINDNASLSYGDPYAVDGVNYQVPVDTTMTPAADYGNGVTPTTPASSSTAGFNLNKAVSALAQGLPGLGDMTGMIGNYMASTAGLKTAAEQRSTDVAHTNVFKNVGKESLKNIDKAQASLEGQKAAAISKVTAQSLGGKKGARGSARGINQSRAMDWLYDTALNQSIAEISANAAQQSSALETQKSTINMQSDIYRGQGEENAVNANEKAKDAYYTAVGKGRNDLAKGVQQTGKDLNAIKQNQLISNLMQQFGKYVTVDAQGNIIKKPNTK